MHYTANDGARLAYETFGDPLNPLKLVLIHGWSGSGKYFARNIDQLAGRAQVFVLDLRFHGMSSTTQTGFTVARLAVDLENFFTALDLKRTVCVGTSMGCAIIWLHHQLFPDQDRVVRAVFVDQAPLQAKRPDWNYGSKGLPDDFFLYGLQKGLREDMAAFARGNADCCLTKTIPEDVSALLTSETLKCDGVALGKLMGDHTNLDHRDTLSTIPFECLNFAGAHSGCFPMEGLKEVERLVPKCKTVVFQSCNHWLYIEDPSNFNRLVLEFAEGGLEAITEQIVL